MSKELKTLLNKLKNKLKETESEIPEDFFDNGEKEMGDEMAMLAGRQDTLTEIIGDIEEMIND